MKRKGIKGWAGKTGVLVGGFGSSKRGLEWWWESLMWGTLQESLGKNISTWHILLHDLKCNILMSTFAFYQVFSSEAILVHNSVGLPFVILFLNGNSLPRPSIKTCLNMFIFLHWWLSHWHNLLAHILDLIGNVFRGCGLFTAWLPDRRISESAWTTVLPDASDSFWSSGFLGTRNCCGSALLWIFESEKLSHCWSSRISSGNNSTPKKLWHIFLSEIHFFLKSVYYAELRLV